MCELHFYGKGFIIEPEPQDTIMTSILPTRLLLLYLYTSFWGQKK